MTSPELDGPVFAHFSMIKDRSGFRELHAGEEVSFTWEIGQQDGCRFRAVDIRSAPPAPGASPSPRNDGESAAYESSLTIYWDEGRTTREE